MYLKRRNIVAWILILAAALCGAFARRAVPVGGVTATTSPSETTAMASDTFPPETTMVQEQSESGTKPSTTTVYTEPTTHPAEYPSTDPGNPGEIVWEPPTRQQRFLGFALGALAVIAGAVAVFVLWQRRRLLGPDGMLLLAGFLCSGLWSVSLNSSVATFFGILSWLAVFREFWGWLRNRFTLSWCVVLRIGNGIGLPQLALIVPALGLAASCVAARSLYSLRGFWNIRGTFICALLFGFLCLACLWRYGKDLRHFEKQLQSFREGENIAVGTGAFAEDEQLLEKIRAEHEEAVKQAVTSERFKVELISNVSHDLRTPLTSILGYGELLERETLSDTGKTQLAQLNRKAGYMRDLVESLFELTKVSSGAIESKRERIDLIRLLEQTLGFFDDQLTAAGLKVCRRYGAESVVVITDGARMHQVFANLLGNAMKYALTGTRIHLEVREEPECWCVRMVNTASYEMDFDPEQILQRFARGDKARSGEGSGLGLAIAQTYTESVGGSFSVAVDGDQFSALVRLPKI